MRRHLRTFLAGATLAVALMGTLLSGQQASGTVPVADEFSRLHFRSIGPASMSGRIADIAVYEANPAIYYVGTAHGGVWKTTNNGATFTPQFQDKGLISIGDVAVSQSNPDLVWVGTGESNNRQSTSWGGGVYKSTDGGKTWKFMGLADSKHINRIVIDPTQQQHRARRGDRCALRTGRRSRRLQDDRRRRDVEAGVEGRRRHGRERSRDGGDRPERSVRVDVSASALAVLHERRRTRQRHLEIDRRRRQLDAARRADCRRATRPHRARRLSPKRRTSSTPSIEGPGGRGRRARRRWRGGGGGAAGARRCAAPAARTPLALAPASTPAAPASIDRTTAARRGARTSIDQPAPDVLQSAPRRSEQPGSDLVASVRLHLSTDGGRTFATESSRPCTTTSTRSGGIRTTRITSHRQRRRRRRRGT